MPLNRFICPDKVEVDLGQCLTKCRMATRCLSLPTLYAIVAGHREFGGRPSTTMLMNGTMQEYLKIKESYAIDPRNRTFALMGIEHHKKVAAVQGDWDSEQQLAAKDGISGIADLLIPDEDRPGYHVLLDYKNYGSYKVGKALGLVVHEEDHPTEVYKRSGKWGAAGTPKRVKVWLPDENQVDLSSEKLQLNHYRVLAERTGRYKISRLELQITVRDGGTMSAKGRGVMDNIYYPVHVPMVEDDVIIKYFARKNGALMNSVEENSMPDVCTDEERWQGRKCADYCDVARFCPEGQRILWLEKNKN